VKSISIQGARISNHDCHRSIPVFLYVNKRNTDSDSTLFTFCTSSSSSPSAFQPRGIDAGLRISPDTRATCANVRRRSECCSTKQDFFYYHVFSFWIYSSHQSALQHWRALPLDRRPHAPADRRTRGIFQGNQESHWNQGRSDYAS